MISAMGYGIQGQGQGAQTNTTTRQKLLFKKLQRHELCSNAEAVCRPPLPHLTRKNHR